MTPDAVFDLVIRASYLLVAALTLVGLIRHRDSARLDIALPFNSLAIVILIPMLRDTTGFTAPLLSAASSLLLLAQPYLFMRLLKHFRVVAVAVERIVIAGMLLSGIALVVSPTPLPTFLSLAIVAYFIGVELYTVVSFVQGALRTRGVTRSQLLLIAAGSGLFASIILLTGIGVVLPAAVIAVSPVVRVGAVLSALSYYLGFGSPRWLRRAWQHGELHHFLQGAAQLAEVEQRAEAIEYLCRFAVRAVGGQAAVVALWDETKQEMALQEPGDASSGQPLAVDRDDVVGRTWRDQKPLAAFKAPDFGPACADRAAALGTRALYAVPISFAGQRAGLLLVFLRGALFPEDDLDLLMLFAWQNARTLRFLSLIDVLRYQFDLLGSVSDIIVSTDADTRIRSWNKAAETAYGWKAEEVLGKPSPEILNPRFVGQTSEQVAAQIMARGFFQGEVTHNHKDGRDVHLLASSSVVRNSQNRVIGFVVVGHDITERKQAEERFRGLLESAPDAMVIVNSQGQIVLVNKQTQRLFGYSMDELLGQPVELLVPKRFRRIHPDQQAQYFSDPRSRPLGESRELYGLRKNGTEFPAEISLSPLETSEGILVSSAIRDVTERKQTEERLRHERDLMQALMDNIPDTIYFKDTASRFTRINQAQARVLGVEKPDDAIGKTDLDFQPAHLARPFLEEEQQIIETGQPLVDRVELNPTPDGTPRWFSATKVPLKDPSGQIVGLVGVSRDVTRSKQAEEQINELNKSLTDRAEELESANKELEAFSYSVSHDLRAPLRTVDGFSRILLEEHGPHLPADATRYLGLVREGAQQMGRLIDDLLAFSRLGRQPLKDQPIDPGDLARQVLSDLDAERDGRQVEVSIGDMPTCQADPALLKQVFANLLANALKFTRQRQPARIEVGCNAGNGECVYYVKDNGAGFDMQYADKLFGVFQRLHRAEDYEGTGVGLATVQRIIHRHGGRIWAEAEMDRGATFYFTLGGDGSHDG